MLKGITPKKKKEVLPFDFEFEIDGVSYPFTSSGYDQEDALRKLERVLVIIRGDISQALGEADVDPDEEEPDQIKVAVQKHQTPKKPEIKKVFAGFKKPPEPSVVHENGIKTNPYNRDANKLTRKGVKEVVD